MPGVPRKSRQDHKGRESAFLILIGSEGLLFGVVDALRCFLLYFAAYLSEAVGIRVAVGTGLRPETRPAPTATQDFNFTNINFRWIVSVAMTEESKANTAKRRRVGHHEFFAPAALLVLAALSVLGCGSSPIPPNNASDRVGVVDTRRPVSNSVVPSGRWFLGDLEHSGCVDCPTPQFAVVTRYVEGLAPSVSELSRSPVGYPLVMLPHELGLSSRRADLRQAVVVFSMFSDRSTAERWRDLHEQGSEVRQVDLQRSQASPLVVRVRRPAKGFDEAQVREADGFPENLEPVCRLAEGHAEVIEDVDYDAGDVLRVPDGSPWIRLTCDGHTALFRAQDTDFGLIIQRDGHRLVETQYDGGVCGIKYYQRRVFDASGRITEEQHLETGRCFDQPPGDSWGACPGNSLGGCADRARTLLDERTDLRRAARLAAYACNWGSDEACTLGWTIDLERRIPVGEVLVRAISYCMFDETENPASSICAAVDGLLRSTDPDLLRGSSDSVRGSVGRQGCLRQISGWCELLETSPICSLDGCG